MVGRETRQTQPLVLVLVLVPVRVQALPQGLVQVQEVGALVRMVGSTVVAERWRTSEHRTEVVLAQDMMRSKTALT